MYFCYSEMLWVGGGETLFWLFYTKGEWNGRKGGKEPSLKPICFISFRFSHTPFWEIERQTDKLAAAGWDKELSNT